MAVSLCARAGWGAKAPGLIAARGALLKLASVLLAVVIVLAGQIIVAGAPGVTAASGDTVWVNTDYLNVRSDASLSSSVYEVVPGGTQFTAAGDPANGFQPVYYGNGIAWLWSDYLSWSPVDASTFVAVGGDTSGGPVAAPSGGAEHWIDVNRSTGAVSLMVGDQAQATFYGSMGFDQSSDGFYSTAIGTYHVYSIYLPLSYTPFAKAYISGWVGFDPDRQNGFHSYTKDANGNIVPGGSGATGGCVALAPGDIDQLDNFAFIGMRVSIHW